MLALAALATACVLSIDPLPSTPSGGDAGGPTGDGATGSDASDAGTDTGANDAALADGGADAATPCASPHLFCADFDGTNLDDGFEYFEHTDAGVSMVADGTWWVSPPRAARVVITGFDGGTSHFARVGVKNKLPHVHSHVRYSYDLRVEKADLTSGDNTLQIDLLVLIGGSSTYELGFILDGSGGRMTEYNNVDYEPHAANVASLTVGKWSHLVLDVELGPSPTLAFAVDDKTVLPKTAFKFAFDASDVGLSLSTGLEYAPGPNTQVVDYSIDNVVLDAN